ncbi:MAG: hypothetical protein KIT31_29565 [Deltaproteobacteria bacterium]|nr:hypothetical protein [Deltaproteobacteria bacterium]
MRRRKFASPWVLVVAGCSGAPAPSNPPGQITGSAVVVADAAEPFGTVPWTPPDAGEVVARTPASPPDGAPALDERTYTSNWNPCNSKGPTGVACNPPRPGAPQSFVARIIGAVQGDGGAVVTVVIPDDFDRTRRWKAVLVTDGGREAPKQLEIRTINKHTVEIFVPGRNFRDEAGAYHHVRMTSPP